jgi:hypothetical protein
MITRTIDGLAVIMDPREGKVLSLNPVGTLIWDLADGNNTQEQILAAVCSEFDVRREPAASDLEEFVETLAGKNLFLAEE